MDSAAEIRRDGRFHTTQWTLVFSAAASDSAARIALGTLCGIYWYPLYAFIRRQGFTAPEAEDLTQEFFGKLIEKEYLAQVDRSRGRFRTFLLTSVKNFLANEHDRAMAQKRGGGIVHIALSAIDAEERFAREPAGGLTPEQLFARAAALSLLDTALGQLRAEYEERGSGKQFDWLVPLLTGDPDEHQEKAAEALGMSSGAVRVALHRMRQHFRSNLRQLAASLVTGPDQIDDELRHLLSAFAQ